MTETKLLIGSLSNDLLRVAVMIQRSSSLAAGRFYQEAQRWSYALQEKPAKSYIKDIINEVSNESFEKMNSLAQAERLLMYSILLQNYALHLGKK